MEGYRLHETSVRFVVGVAYDACMDEHAGSVATPVDANGDMTVSQCMHAVFEGLRCVVAPRGGVYVSAPITTGRRFLEWRRRVSWEAEADGARYRDSHRAEVVAPNVAAVERLVLAARRHFRDPVIDPTALKDQPGWTQREYHALWTRVVHELAHSVVFADGWEYSCGCLLEFTVAAHAGHRLYNADFHDLDPAATAALLRDVAAADVSESVPPEVLKGAHDAAEALVARAAR